MQGAGANSVFARLLVKILAMISEENDGTMTRSEAERDREELMAQRTVIVEANNGAFIEVVRTHLHLVSVIT